MFLYLFILIILFIYFNHPFYSTIMLLFISFSVLTILNIFSSWMSFILCLVYLGGVLILFMYMSSLMPNMKLSVKSFFLFLLMAGGFFIFYEFEVLVFSAVLFFYSKVFFNYWLFFLCFMLMVLLVVSDFSKDLISPMRVM